jgi:hypothetical protein
MVTTTPVPAVHVDIAPIPAGPSFPAAAPADRTAGPSPTATRPVAKPSGKPAAKSVTTRKPALKARKLCWKDGRLDVCP